MSDVIKFEKPKYRPWRLHEVPIATVVHNHGKGDELGRYLILGADNRGVMLFTEIVPFKEMLECYTMGHDGKPCGVEL